MANIGREPSKPYHGNDPPTLVIRRKPNVGAPSKVAARLTSLSILGSGMPTTNEVFGITRDLPLNYVVRQAVDERLVNELSAGLLAPIQN